MDFALKYGTVKLQLLISCFDSNFHMLCNMKVESVSPCFLDLNINAVIVV